MLHLEPQPEQNALFQNARLDLGMSDGAQQDRRKLSQLLGRAVGQHFLRAQVTIPAKIIRGVMEFDAEFFGGGIEHFDGFPCHFRTGTVAADDCDVVTFHKVPVERVADYSSLLPDFQSNSPAHRPHRSTRNVMPVFPSLPASFPSWPTLYTTYPLASFLYRSPAEAESKGSAGAAFR